MLCFGRQHENLIQWYTHSHSPFFCELPSAVNYAIGTLGSMNLAKVLKQKLSESAEITVDFPSPVQFRSVQSLSRVWLFVTPWIAAHQASLSINNSQSLLKLMSIESVMPSQPSHPLSSPSPPAFNLSHHQGLFKWISSLHQVAKVLESQLQHQSFQWIPRTDL